MKKLPRVSRDERFLTFPGRWPFERNERSSPHPHHSSRSLKRRWCPFNGIAYCFSSGNLEWNKGRASICIEDILRATTTRRHHLQRIHSPRGIIDPSFFSQPPSKGNSTTLAQRRRERGKGEGEGRGGGGGGKTR